MADSPLEFYVFHSFTVVRDWKGVSGKCASEYTKIGEIRSQSRNTGREEPYINQKLHTFCRTEKRRSLHFTIYRVLLLE